LNVEETVLFISPVFFGCTVQRADNLRLDFTSETLQTILHYRNMLTLLLSLRAWSAGILTPTKFPGGRKWKDFMSYEES